MIGNTSSNVKWFAIKIALIDKAHIGISFDFWFITIVNHYQADVETTSHDLDDTFHRISFGSSHFPDEGVVAVFACTFSTTT